MKLMISLGQITQDDAWFVHFVVLLLLALLSLCYRIARFVYYSSEFSVS